MKKLLLRIALVLVILVVLAIVAVGLSLDSAIKKGVETLGPQMTKVDIQLAGVNLSLFSGSGSIKGLVIGNPEGYKTPHAISVGSTSVSVSPGSLLSDKIVIKSIRIEAPEITLEVGPGGSNLQKIQANLESTLGAGGNASPPATGERKPAKKLQVDEVVISGGKVTLGAALLGGKVTEAALPEINLKDLGAGPDGITAAELGKRLLSVVMDRAIKVGGDELAKAGKDALNKTANEAAGKATKALGDLLNKKKE
jgi:uncharacterized protein involved in outer membrane biogenesis